MSWGGDNLLDVLAVVILNTQDPLRLTSSSNFGGCSYQSIDLIAIDSVKIGVDVNSPQPYTLIIKLQVVLLQYLIRNFPHNFTLIKCNKKH